MKARKVKGIDPQGPLGDNAQRIVAVRLDEVCAFTPRVFDPAEVEALHDMRIAAKRLRYVIEVTGELFGPYARTAGKRVKELQDLLGDIHDCDVVVPRLLELAGEADDRQRRGVDALVAHHRARRERLFGEFLAFWERLEAERFRERLEAAIVQRPAGSTAS